MAYFPDTMPAVHPNFDDRDFWAACNHGQLQFQACADCGAARHPPTPVCPHCRSFKVAWKQAAGDAEVFVEMFLGFLMAMAAGIACIYMVLLLLFNHALLPLTPTGMLVKTPPTT